MAAAGTLIVLFMPSSEYRCFLYTLEALFSPLYAVVLGHHFVTASSQVRGALVGLACGIGMDCRSGFLLHFPRERYATGRDLACLHMHRYCLRYASVAVRSG